MLFNEYNHHFFLKINPIIFLQHLKVDKERMPQDIYEAFVQYFLRLHS